MIIMICSHHSKVAQYYWRLKYNWSISNRVITDNHRESIHSFLLPTSSVSPYRRTASYPVETTSRLLPLFLTAPRAISRAPAATSALPARWNVARETGRRPETASSWRRNRGAASTRPPSSTPRSVAASWACSSSSSSSSAISGKSKRKRKCERKKIVSKSS